MALRRPSVLISLGLLLLIAAVAVRFIVVPGFSGLPGDLDVTSRTEGEGTFLNAAALQSGDVANVIAKDVPVSLDRHIYVSETHGDTAIVHDDQTINVQGGVPIRSNHTYAVHRKTMESAPAPTAAEVEPHTGFTIALPAHPDSNTKYSLYDSATRQTVPMNYTGTKTISGREVLTYDIEALGGLADPAILGALPPVLPKAQLVQLTPVLPADVLAKMTPDLIAALPDLVPVTYTSVARYGLAVDKTLGTPIDVSIAQQVIANVSANGQMTSVVPVIALNTKFTPQSVANAADTAESVARLLATVSIVLPTLLTALGMVLIVLGLVRRRARTAEPEQKSPVQ